MSDIAAGIRLKSYNEVAPFRAAGGKDVIDSLTLLKQQIMGLRIERGRDFENSLKRWVLVSPRKANPNVKLVTLISTEQARLM